VREQITILGGGIIGLTCAYELAKAGCRVTVLDHQAMGREGSWASAGILPPGNPSGVTSALDRLRAVTVDRFPTFSRELQDRTGIDNGYRITGGVEFLEEDDLHRTELWANEGLDFRQLDDTCFTLSGYAQVRTPWHLRALQAACVQLGVILKPNTDTAELKFDAAMKYVVALGAWTGEWLKRFDIELRIKPMLGQILLVHNARGMDTPIVCAGKRYIVPRDSRHLLVGSTEEPEAGFVKHTTEVAKAELLRFAVRHVPGAAEATVEAHWCGLRPASADGWPYIGPLPGLPNVIVAAGHFRSGVQQSVATALLVVEWLTGAPSGLPSGPFLPSRRTIPTGRAAFRS